jgi:sugar phosphate isomerase/epimerase
MDLFCGLVAAIRHPAFGVNYDQSNANLAGDDPLELLRRVSSRVVTMHASDRYLLVGRWRTCAGKNRVAMDLHPV